MAMKFLIYRYNPEVDVRPHIQAFELADDCGAIMLLDALMLLKAKDDSLTFRRSCKEGVCGSDAMNINGRNGLACILPLKDLKQPIDVRPLPGLPVIRDLVTLHCPLFRLSYPLALAYRHSLLVTRY